MMWNEFEEIAGYEVSYEDYTNIIEPMYNATNLSKQEFVKTLNKKAFALPTKKEMIREMKKIANHLAEICGHSTDWKAEQQLEDLAKKYANRFFGLDWGKDIEAYVYFNRGYEYTNQRGCSFPRELVIGKGYFDYERIELVKC